MIQRIEYTLFQPGLFLNYFTHPHKSAEHVHSFETQFDIENRRAIVPDRCDDTLITLTTVQDLANVVARAVEYEDTWPVVGGAKGCDVSITELIRLAEEIRGLYPPYHSHVRCDCCCLQPLALYYG
jgi:hypothetical protein